MTEIKTVVRSEKTVKVRIRSCNENISLVFQIA